ncbi:fasciclin domain-containing protein [Lysobacter firmicutimachus]|uniref:Fasciclin domain-containing protein n=1 Tax=Lysobacter firmicutimachus TaxID=1792846 RepID=A0AAU8MNH4_9GAMM
MNSSALSARVMPRIVSIARPDSTARKLLEVAAEHGFSVFCDAAERAGLRELLDGPGPFTAFIPTDAAFGMLPDGYLESLLLAPNQPRLIDLLCHHLIARRKTVAEFERWSSLKTLHGNSLAIQSVDRHVMVGIAKVVQPNLHASNAAIHGIDRVNRFPDAR